MPLCSAGDCDALSLIQGLNHENLLSEGDLGEALLRLTKSLSENHYHCLFSNLLSPPPCISRPALELVLSSAECGTILARWLEDQFPRSHEQFSGSLQAAILDRLSLSIHFLFPFDRDTARHLNELRLWVENGPLVLNALTQIKPTHPEQEAEAPLDDDLPTFIQVKKSQRQRKVARSARKVRFDTKTLKALLDYGIDAMSIDSNFDASHEFQVVLNLQKRVLKTYIAYLRRPSVEDSIKRAYILRESSDAGTEEVTLEESGETQEAEVSNPAAPAAFPMVQPMKAALYFDSADGFGEWRILISTRADRDLREARRKDAKFFKIVVKKIKELSNGHFSDDNQKRLNSRQIDVPIYEAKMTRDSRLVYQVDCIPEYNSDVERQVIKIFGVYTHAQIDQRLWDSVSHQLGRKGKEYRQRCLFRNRPESGQGNVFTPACFPPKEEIEEEVETFPELPRENLEEIHALLVLEKFMPFSQALLNSIIADMDVAHVFDVSPQEKEIIEYPHSCYVLGRSGTGKTTTMMFKMLGIERAYTMRKDSMHKPRQIFVTQSRVLAGKVEEYFAKLLDSLATAEKTKEELVKIIKTRKQQGDEEGLVDIDDDRNWRNDLPQKFSELRDEHFPLFITFDRLASLLEADIDISSASSSGGTPNTANGTSPGRMTLVDYRTFLDFYWPHFSQNLRKGLDPALVYSELMGVIQGSEESLNHGSRFLDKSAYENLSARTQFAFAGRRDTIYSVFLLYLKQKRLRHEYDAADRTHSILNAFREHGVPGQKIDYIYVDEVQDNLLIDTLRSCLSFLCDDSCPNPPHLFSSVLRSLVRNPDGLFWAGDTAQTISVGSSFRFDDLKAFLFRLERRRENSLTDIPQAPVHDPPRTFQLTVNYRSHGGIVQCAHSVIELITEFWPYAIDILSREKGVVDGSKPVFFSGWDSDTVRYEQFLFGESGSPIEFGAQQCILVRDEASREDLRRQVGDIGLIMTLYESKGLEFDDVLLYKFFEDSTVELSQWRVVLNLLKDDAVSGPAAPQFDENRHAGLCSELKFLYVAITRARKNLWIVDCSEKSEPMRTFWTSRNEVQNCTPGTDVPRLAVSSSPQEWEKSGRTLFQNKRYLQAMHCFERAGLDREVEVARTYYLREQARSMPVNGSKQAVSARRAAFATAAEAFLGCSVAARNSKERKAYLRNAGDCFERAEEDQKAADAYHQAEEYNTAVKLYRKCARFDEAVAIVTRKRQDIETDVAENIIDVARLFYFKGGELEKASQLFTSVEEQLEYLEDFDLDISRAALLESLGRFREAAEIHLTEGRTLEAIRLFLNDQSNVDSVRRANDCILQGLWEKVSFGVRDLDRIDAVPELLELARKVKQSDVLDPHVSDELSMFHLINIKEWQSLRTLGRKFAADNHLTSALLCYDHFFHTWPKMRNLTSADISGLLDDFLQYCGILHQLVSSPDPSNNPRLRRLFGIMPSSDRMFFLRCGTFLHDMIVDSRAILAASNDQGVYISEWELSRRFREILLNRLNIRIVSEANACAKDAPAFYPCPVYILTSNCFRRECPREHLPKAALTRDWYALQVKIHLQQVLVIQALACPPLRKGEKLKNIRFWLSRLYETLYPISFVLGGITNFDVARTPEARRSFAALRQWCLDILNHRGYSQFDSGLLTTLYQVVKILHQVDRTNATRFIMGSQLLTQDISTDRKYHRKVGDTDVYVIPELVFALSAVSYDSICHGVFFLKHLVDAMLPLDAVALCEIIEYLCGSIVLVRNKLAFHNVTLPLSWLKVLIPRLVFDVKAKQGDLNPTFDVLVTTMQQIIKSLYAGNGDISHLLVLAENTNLHGLNSYRNIYIARLCRTLCILGYNVNNRDLRDQIMQTMRALKSKPHNLFRDFAYARDWRNLARLVENSSGGSSFDNMIQLYHNSEVRSSKPPPRGVRRLVFKTMAEIPRLLEGARPQVVSDLRADAPEFVPKPRQPDAPADDAEAEQDIEEPEEDNTQIINTAHSAEAIAVAALPEEESKPSEEQIQAALKIQAIYRKVLKRRRIAPKTAVEASRKSCFEACLEESFKINWPQTSFYRKLFLGPLPHVLVCLSAARTWALETKARNKKRFKSATHRDLEDVNRRLTEQKKLIHGIQKLQKILSPASELHRKRDVEELKKRIIEVDTFLKEKVPIVARDVEEDIAIGIKGIVTPKPLPKPKLKPLLRIDDDDMGQDEYEVDGDFYVPNDEEVVETVADVPEEGRPVQLDSAGGEKEFAQSSTVMQSLSWAPIAPDNSFKDGSNGLTPAAGDASQGKTYKPAQVVQSLSWIPI